MPEVYSAQQIETALQLTPAVQAEVKVMAGLLGVDWRKLLACIIRQVGIIRLVRCIIAVAGGQGDLWTCLGDINWEGIIGCAGEVISIPAGPSPTPPPSPTPLQGYAPNTQNRCG